MSVAQILRGLRWGMFFYFAILIFPSNVLYAQQCGGGQTTYVPGCDGKCNPLPVIAAYYTCEPINGVCSGLATSTYCQKDSSGKCFENSSAVWIPCGGGSGGGSCFPAGTGVSLVDGNFKNIEDVKVGDRVWGLNEMGVKTVNTVKRLIQPVSDNMCKISFKDGQSLKVTNSHPLYTSKGWKAISVEAAEKEMESVPVTKLEIGDRMLKVDGTRPEVVKISCWQETAKTYNFTVDNSNTYFAGGFLAHNKAGNAAWWR